MSEDTRNTADGRLTHNVGLGRPRKLIASSVLVGVIVLAGGALALWKDASIARAEEAAASQPEPMESITATVAKEREHRQTTTSIGTVLALRSVALRNELSAPSGTSR